MLGLHVDSSVPMRPPYLNLLVEIDGASLINTIAAVFLARSEFLSRLEQPVLRAWLAKRLLVARLRFHELGADEIPVFIHHQLPSREAEEIFTDEAIAAIANVSGGDPVLVNRFSRRSTARRRAPTTHSGRPVPVQPQ